MTAASTPAFATPVRRTGIYYGWYIVGVCFLAQLMSWGLMFYALTFFVAPMTSSLGWTVTQFSVVYTLNSLLWGFAAPLLGGYVDRHGVRNLMVIGSLGTGLGLAGVAYVSNLLVFYLVLGVFVTICMVLMAGMSSVAISNWFIEKRGRTLAIMSMGSSVGGLTLAPLSALLIGEYGWRMVWLVFGALVVSTVTLPALFVMKRRPEDMGLFPDGKSHPPDQAPNGERIVERKILWTRTQAARTPTFWFLIVGFSLNYLAVGSLLVHLAPFLGTKHFNAGQTAFAVLLFSFGSLIVKPVTGILLDRFTPRYVAAASTCLSAVGLLMLIVGQGTLLYAGIVVYALSFGGTYPMEEVMWANSFGRWTLGKVRSLAFPFTVALGSAGPIIGGMAYDSTGSYIGAFWVFIFAYVISAATLAFARPPRPVYVEETISLPAPTPVPPPPGGWRDRAIAFRGRAAGALAAPRSRTLVPASAAVLAVAAVLSLNAANIKSWLGSQKHT